MTRAGDTDDERKRARTRSVEDRSAWERARAGVVPLAGKARRRAAAAPTLPHAAAPSPGSAEAPARGERIRAPVTRSTLRVAQSEDGDVEGLREGAARTLLRELRGKNFHPERTLDLHGMRSGEAIATLERFVCEQRDRGARNVLVVTGKGLHSQDGVAVLRDAVVTALQHGPAAPCVQAFATAHGSLGGRGALALRLR